MTAPALTPAEQAEVTRFGAHDEEILRDLAEHADDTIPCEWEDAAASWRITISLLQHRLDGLPEAPRRDPRPLRTPRSARSPLLVSGVAGGRAAGDGDRAADPGVPGARVAVLAVAASGRPHRPLPVARMSLYYEDDYVRLFHGDCRDETEWLTADVLVVDPPYGRDWKQGNIKEARWLRAQDSDAHAGIANDSDTAVRDAMLSLWGDRPWVVFGDLMLPPPAGTKLTSVYWKDSGTSGFRGAIAGIRRDAEAIYFGGSHKSGLGGRSSIFRYGGSVSGSHGLTGLTGHPHTKPVPIMQALIEQCPAGTIADPSSGSGSTLIAARNLGRKAIGVEVQEEYCELIASRLAQQAFDFSALTAAVNAVSAPDGLLGDWEVDR